jgi:hypothetical protein
MNPDHDSTWLHDPLLDPFYSTDLFFYGSLGSPSTCSSSADLIADNEASPAGSPTMPKAEHNVDLQCSLCPKNPKFSDVSHLLTHISSKSHLATRFKLQIQAQGDMTAKSQLDHFDFWYRTSNIDALLANRMAAKEHKKTKKSRNSNASNATVRAILSMMIADTESWSSRFKQRMTLMARDLLPSL